MALKCKINAKAHVKPVKGTEFEGKGTCPECLTPGRKLTSKGFIGAHNVVIGADSTIPVTDTGAYIGAPRDAAMKREMEGRRISAGLESVPHAQESDKASAHRGPTLIHGRDMNAVSPSDTSRLIEPSALSSDMAPERDAEKPHSGTMEGNLGRVHFDESIIGKRDKGRRTRTQRRNWQRKQSRAAKRA